MAKERSWTNRFYRADWLSCPILIDNNFSDITNRENSAIYVGESIKPLNKRMNIHRKGKSRFEISINHYKNVCKKIFFTIQITEKLPGNGNKNGSIDHKILEYRLQGEGYWVKTLRFTYALELNEKP